MEIETINKQEKQDPAAPIFSKCLKVHETPKSKRRRNSNLLAVVQQQHWNHPASAFNKNRLNCCTICRCTQKTKELLYIHVEL
jgi:hypothetical protein